MSERQQAEMLLENIPERNLHIAQQPDLYPSEPELFVR